MKKSILIITGNAGEIGSAIAKAFNNEGYKTIGIDQKKSNNTNESLEFNIADICSDKSAEDRLKKWLANKIPKDYDITIVNNAAIQITGSVQQLNTEHLMESLKVNCVAPFGLVKIILDLAQNQLKTVINISSIHQNLTKKNFLPYSVSKTALSGLTKAMALEIGDDVRVCEISPAAIDTKMLHKGFENDEDKIETLKSYHPTGCIGTPEDVAKLVSALAQIDSPFLNGTRINFDGGISYVLSDPQNEQN